MRPVEQLRVRLSSSLCPRALCVSIGKEKGGVLLLNTISFFKNPQTAGVVAVV